MRRQAVYHGLINLFLPNARSTMHIQQKVNLYHLVGNKLANIFSRQGAVATYGCVPAAEKFIDKLDEQPDAGALATLLSCKSTNS